jgi:hypothetical protein
MMIVLVSVIHIRLLLLMLDRAALMMRRHVLSGVARGTSAVRELHAPVVVGLETRFLIESIFETYAIVGHVSLFITGGKGTCYTL